MAAELAEDASITTREHPLAGIAYAVGAFTAWGILPLYFQWLHHIAPVEILAQRIFWTFVTVLAIQFALGRVSGLKALIATPKTAAAWIASSLCIGANWLIFVYAATHGQVLETSLGYFICPLLNVLLGVVLLGERLSPVRALAVLLAATAILLRIGLYGHLPLIALSLAASFAAYGFLRKHLKADPLTGLLGDTLFLVPPAFGYLVYTAINGSNTFLVGTNVDRVLLYLLAPITLVPLAWFAAGAKRLPLATLGFVQYLAPSLSFLGAILVLHEPLDGSQLAAFALIWLALVLYTTDAWKSRVV